MISHEPILRNPQLNSLLFEEGFVTLPFLDHTEVAKLKQIFHYHHNELEPAEGLHVSSHIKSEQEIDEISKKLQQVFEEAISRHVENGMTLGGTFLTRPPHQSEPLHPHQDWSIVDESRFRSYTIWVPLSDVDENNGCLHVLPKSHEYARGYRHVSIDSIFGQIYDTVWKHIKPIPLRAGEAIIFDHALGHASKPNTTSEPRIIATHSLISRNPEMRFYWNNNGTIEEYIGEKNFYNSEEAKTGPVSLQKIRNLDFKPYQLTEQEFLTLAGVEFSRSDSDNQTRGIMRWIKKMVS